ncbi:MAG: helix-turn-helix domain-containing protein, partial [Gammaproteobacteria bacterium]
YEPVPFDVEATTRRWMRDPKFRVAYEALEDEFAALGELLRARQAAGLTQAQVAERMGVPQASVGRLESSAGSRKHAPSVATLRRYADAVGCELRITLTPATKRAKPRHVQRPERRSA